MFSAYGVLTTSNLPALLALCTCRFDTILQKTAIPIGHWPYTRFAAEMDSSICNNTFVELATEYAPIF